MEVEAGEHRDELLAGLHGRVVEIGAGNGLNFAHYPSSVDEVVAVEPEAYLRQKARAAAIEAAAFRVDRVRGYSLGPSRSVTNPHVLGSARAPAGRPASSDR